MQKTTGNLNTKKILQLYVIVEKIDLGFSKEPTELGPQIPFILVPKSPMHLWELLLKI